MRSAFLPPIALCHLTPYTLKTRARACLSVLVFLPLEPSVWERHMGLPQMQPGTTSLRPYLQLDGKSSGLTLELCHSLLCDLNKSLPLLHPQLTQLNTRSRSSFGSSMVPGAIQIQVLENAGALVRGSGGASRSGTLTNHIGRARPLLSCRTPAGDLAELGELWRLCRETSPPQHTTPPPSSCLPSPPAMCIWAGHPTLEWSPADHSRGASLSSPDPRLLPGPRKSSR